MTQRPPRSARLAVTPLETRAVPSTVTATTTARPLVFELRGAVTSDVTVMNGDTPTADGFDGTVTARGTIDYTDGTKGTSGAVLVTGAGSGTVRVGTDPGTDYASTFGGEFTLTDDNGAWATDKAFTGTETRTEAGSRTPGPTTPIGPLAGSGIFDVSDFTVTAVWNESDGTSNSKGSFQGTVTQPGAGQTDLAFGAVVADLPIDGDGKLTFAATAAGALMKAASHGEAAATITAIWEGDDGKTGAADVSVPVSWNAGEVTVSVTGLQRPAWAKALVIKLDAADQVGEADEANNEWRVELTDDPPPAEPTPPPPPPAAPETPPPPPAAPAVRHVGFGVSGDGRNMILWRGSDGSVLHQTAAFGGGYAGPVNVAAGDITGDGVLDVAVAAGTGGGPQVRLIDGQTGQQLGSFYAYDPSFRGGVNVAVADVDGDGRADVITGSGEGGGPVVNVFSGRTGELASRFYAYDASFRGGVHVAAADLDGNGLAEVVAGAGPGGGAVVNIFDGRSGDVVDRFLAGPADGRTGVVVGVKTQSNGKVVVTAEPGRGPTGPLLPATPTPSPTARPGGSLIPNDPIFLG